MSEQPKKGLNISAKSFITAIAVIFLLMILTYSLTFFVPSGEYARTLNENGDTIIDTAQGFSYTEGHISFVQWILSPILVLTAEGSTTLIAVIIFLLVIGGVFNCLEKCNLMKYMLDKIVSQYGKTRYKLMSVIIAFFMALGAMVGSFEETVPLVPIVVQLAVHLGWDPLVGLGMSLVSVGFGFASGVMNPFTVGVAQRLAGIAMFSGVWLRLLSWILIYLLLNIFLRSYAKKIEKPVVQEIGQEFVKDPKMEKALKSFVIILGIGIAAIISSVFVTFLQDYTMIIVAIMFLVAGIVSTRQAGMPLKDRLRVAKDGVISILPGVLMILMASSIKYILTESKILDTLIYGAVNIASGLPKAAVILFIYLIVLVMNFFIASGSAKAFLLIPLIIPIAQVFGISSQLCIVAYAFGDGFSNVFYPTNPVTLISLGLAGVSYTDYAKWSIKLQLINIILTSGILLLGLAVGY